MATKKVKRPPKQAGIGHCIICNATFQYESRIVPSTCGELYCRAMDEWTSEEWEGKARTAHARSQANRQITVVTKYNEEGNPCAVATVHPVTLTPLDVVAMERFPYYEQEKEAVSADENGAGQS